MAHILLVGDHVWFRQALGIILSRDTDFEVITQAETLAECRAGLSDGRVEDIDAAIVDLDLPHGDGTTLIREIGLLRGDAQRIPVMVLAGVSGHEVYDRLRGLGAKEVLSKAASLEEILAAVRRLGGKVKPMHEEQLVSEMVEGVLSRQAMALAGRTGGSFADAFEAVRQTEAGRQLAELRGGPHSGESASRWQKNLAPKRARERGRARQEEHKRVLQQDAWERFMATERREMESRKDGQLARMLGEALPGEPAAALRRLASEDQRQAEEGLVALMSGGKVSYKHIDELSPEDRPARVAANRLRTTWLKERRDGWIDRRECL